MSRQAPEPPLYFRNILQPMFYFYGQLDPFESDYWVEYEKLIDSK